MPRPERLPQPPSTQAAAAASHPHAHTAAWRLPPRPLLAACTLLLLAMLATGALHGAYPLDLPRLAAALWGGLATGSSAPTVGPAAALAADALQADRQLLMEVRLPRLALGLLCGAVLGCAGAAIQGLLRNPLADPGLIGTSAGAAFGAALAIVAVPAFWPGLGTRLGDWPLQIGAFAVGLACTVLVDALARVDGRTHLAVLLLAGVAINALCGAGIGWLSAVATDAQLRALSFWLLGSLGAARWDAVGLAALLSLPALALCLLAARSLNVLALGEAEARMLGVRVEGLKRVVLVGVALAVGATTALTGGVGFIGLLAPHLVRLLAGPDHRVLLPGSALLGAALVLGADTVARTAWAPTEMPLGVLTACLGVPAFIGLLWSQRGRL